MTTMKKLVLILTIIILGACKQQDASSTSTTSDKTDSIKSSLAYKEYVEAFNDYQSCVEERPGFTTAYMNKELTAPEFEKALEKNAKVCALKKSIFNTRWQLLEAQYDELPEEYEIKVN